MSDSHGNQKGISDVLAREKPDIVLHAGDHADDILDLSKKEQMTNVKLYTVVGNCDRPGMADEEQAGMLGTARFLLTHGHRYNVKHGYLNLVLKAEEAKTNLLVFGHIHVPTLFVEAGKLFLNPGSLNQPRGYKTPTYVIFEWPDGVEDRWKCSVQFKSVYDGTLCEDLARTVAWDGVQFEIE